jgi:hypothetical protein
MWTAGRGGVTFMGRVAAVIPRALQLLQRTSKAGVKAKFALLVLVLLIGQLVGWPPIWQSFTNRKADAAGFTMQTGYYIGDGSAGHAITGLGFQPNLVMIKDDTNGGTDGADWSSSAMASGTTAKTADADADVTDGSDITSLDSDGFTVGTGVDANGVGVRFTYIAFGGSNCTSSGTFCVGSYTGNGTSGHAVTVGFKPDLAWVKRSGGTAGVLRTSSMANNVTQFFANTAQNTSGAEFQTLSTAGFTVGTNAAVNTNGSTYWFAAFKKVSGSMNAGSFTGTGAAHSITGMGFAPNFVLFKNATDSTAQIAGYNVTQSDGDDSSTFTDAANTTGNITSLDSNGFSVGTTAAANNSGDTIYWAGFGGSVAASGSGTFTTSNGTYTGNGTGLSVSGLGFTPSLVIIGTDSQYEAFRTGEMKGDDTAVFSNGNADFTGGITSLGTDGFTLGSSTVTNSSGAVYYWTAFGNAWNPETHAGAADFAVGAYTGNGIARTVLNVPFTADMVAVSSESTYTSAWTASGMASGTTEFFTGTAQNTAGAMFASLNPNSFSIGTNNDVNHKGTIYNWFAFKEGANFQTGSYTGNGSSQTVSGSGFQPDMIWAKATTNKVAALSMSSLPAGTSMRFGSNSNSTTDFTNLTSGGFAVGNGVEVNNNGTTYWYAAWQGKAYDQSSYRVFNNTDSTDTGSPLAAQNTAATLRSTGQPFRLRTLVHVDNDTLYAGGNNFKLQYAPMSGTCDTSFSGESYSDVTSSSTIAYYDNPTPSDGDNLTADANDPTDGANMINDETYEEANNFTNATSAISAGQDGEWDFSLVDNGAPASTAYCFRVVQSDGSLLDTYNDIPEIITSDGAFNVDIVNNGGGTVSNPSTAMNSTAMSNNCTDTTGTLGLSNQLIRVQNHSANPKWSLTIAATGGETALWSDGSALYDYNDPSGSPGGCAAGGDSDTYAGQLSVDTGSASVAPESGCNTSGLTLGSNTAFDEGITDALTLADASNGASSGCYWDLTGFQLSQEIPSFQPPGNYTLGMTITLTAD